MCRQSCSTTTNATVMETRTATGAATSTGTASASRGTAISASPNPKADRMIVARNSTAITSIEIMHYTAPKPALSRAREQAVRIYIHLCKLYQPEALGVVYVSELETNLQF